MDNLNTMIKALWLTNELQWDAMLYGLFFLNLILLMTLPSGAGGSTMLGVVVLVSIVIDKTKAFGYMMNTGPYTPDQCHEQIFIGTYLIRVAMFAIPLTIAGTTKNGKTRGLAIMAGVLGGAYMFIRWYSEQRNVSSTELQCAPLAMLDTTMSYVGVVFVLARIAFRDRLSLGSIHRNIPVTIPLDLAANEVEVEIA